VADRELVEACRSVRRGDPFVCAGELTALIQEYQRRSRNGDRIPASILTPREEEVVKLIAEGHSSREIADVLVISVKTVDRHRANVLDKLGMHDRLELARFAIRVGLIEP
jgi:DNA-binding NarL/FixJ family response regulator